MKPFAAGVYQVNIDADQQKVTVSGSVDSATLIKKLVRAGKHAEVWSQKSNQNQNQKQNDYCIKDDKNNKTQKQGIIKGLEGLKNQRKFPAFSSEEDDDYFDGDDENDEEDELRFLSPSHLGLLRQQIEASNGKKNIRAMAAAPNNGNKMNNNVGNGNAQKKGNPNPNQNMVLKVNPGGIDQKAMAALKVNNAQLGGGNISSGEGKRANDIATMMNLAGFHGNGANFANSAAALGCNPNGLGGFQQVQSNIGYQGSLAGGLPGGGYAAGQHPSSMLMSMNGYNHTAAAASAMMNMQNRHILQQQQQPQPQMMYHRSTFVPSNTGYYYNYSPAAYPYIEQPNYNVSNSAATHTFNDETTSSCSIM